MIKPALNINRILFWADAHKRFTGYWPKRGSGRVRFANNETWNGISLALLRGTRGLPCKSSLAELLAKERGRRNRYNLPALSINQILNWADEYYRIKSKMPSTKSGAVYHRPSDTWAKIDKALRNGNRGLPGGSSLSKLFKKHRKEMYRYKGTRSALSINQILQWADAHYTRTGCWPAQKSGPVQENPKLTWAAINIALRIGGRGLPAGLSLPKFREKYRRIPMHCGRPPMSIKKILAWAYTHRARTGRCPNVNAGKLHEAPHENWKAIDQALRIGTRGLLGGTSLYKLMVKEKLRAA